jgi:SM-20-related protein
MSLIGIEAFSTAALVADPFPHAIVPYFIRREAMDSVLADFPDISQGGSFPLSALSYGPAFAELCRELEDEPLRRAFEAKFGMDLSQRPTTLTVRGRCRSRDGQIHTDTKSKLITVLVYVNRSWPSSGGRLRLLRSPTDLEDYAAEVSPDQGTLLCFRNGSNAWHGHPPFEGTRRVLQLNWVTDERAARKAERRHGLSAFFKNLNAFKSHT